MDTLRVGEWFDDLIAGLAAYFLTSLPVVLGILFGVDFLRTFDGQNALPRRDLLTACTQFDAKNYVRIMRDGYDYSPDQRSTVAFFPVFPLVGSSLSYITGWLPEIAALTVANVALAITFVLLARYTRLRWPEASAGQRALVLQAFGLWPATLFFRMPYAESLLLCSTLIVLIGRVRGWPLLLLAFVAGFATATRPVGVAVTAAFVWHVLTLPGISLAARVGRVVVLGPVACWGLLAYMTYQAHAFGNAFAFAQTQEHWTVMAPHEGDWQTKLYSLLTLEPVWGVYMPGNARYWANFERHDNPAVSMLFWNPILFLLAVGLLLLGARKCWLTGVEVVLGACLLVIPYLTRSYEMSMASHARFAAVVVVNYLVVGRILAVIPPVLTCAFSVISALLLFSWSALFATGFRVF
ncbi:MAG: hypothetical protein L0215_22790 [Gemmataceae bacterium]|nr:hypothetical protein [Gemmataceae bacterium]